MLVILPFWTSFLIRVYAWIGILKPEGLLNRLPAHGSASSTEPLHDPDRPTGGLYRHRLFLPALHDAAALRGAGKAGRDAARGGRRSRLPAAAGLLEDHLPAVAAGRHRRLLPGLHPGRRRVRHPGSARRLRHADDRQDALDEFFNNRDWPLASAVAVDAAARSWSCRSSCSRTSSRSSGGKDDEDAARPGSTSTSVTLGFAFLYSPIVHAGHLFLQ